jgi:hypothetical protein
LSIAITAAAFDAITAMLPERLRFAAGLELAWPQDDVAVALAWTAAQGARAV